MDAGLADALALVAAHGAPAQKSEAVRLLSVLAGAPDDAAGVAGARKLINAYLHDPYLERG